MCTVTSRIAADPPGSAGWPARDPSLQRVLLVDVCVGRIPTTQAFFSPGARTALRYLFVIVFIPYLPPRTL